MIHVGILALENCMQSSVSGPFDILSVASLEWQRRFPGEKKDLFFPKIITDDGSAVTCFNGITLSPQMGKEECGALDVLFIPVVYGRLDPILSDRRLIGWLRDQHEKGTCICAVCAGVFLAAETGLLDKRQATTHWHLAADFQKRYPNVILKPEKMIVDAGDFITAGGVTAYMDLAKTAGLEPRTFARRFKRATGDTPLEYLQHLRIGKARTLLETTSDTIDAITWATGYEDISSFRRLFKKSTGLSPTAYRKKFSLLH